MVGRGGGEETRVQCTIYFYGISPLGGRLRSVSEMRIVFSFLCTKFSHYELLWGGGGKKARRREKEGGLPTIEPNFK